MLQLCNGSVGSFFVEYKPTVHVSSLAGPHAVRSSATGMLSKHHKDASNSGHFLDPSLFACFNPDVLLEPSTHPLERGSLTWSRSLYINMLYMCDRIQMYYGPLPMVRAPNLKSSSHQPVFEVSAVDPHNFPGWEILQASWYWKQCVTVIKWQKVGANPTAKINEGPATEMWTWAMQSCQPKSISKGLVPVAVLSHTLAVNVSLKS